MSEATKSVERRAGQRYLRPGNRESTIEERLPNGNWTFSPPDPDGCVEVSDGWLAANWTLLSDAPPAGPDRACKAPEWCGFRADSETDERRARWIASVPRGELHPRIYGGCLAGDMQYCSPACRNARVPPLPVTPEAKSFTVTGASKPENNGTYRIATPAQEAPKVLIATCTCPDDDQPGHLSDCPRFVRIDVGREVFQCDECDLMFNDVKMRVTRNGREKLCDHCMDREEEQVRDLMMFESTGTPYAGPTRLPPKPMAHVGHEGGDVTL